MITLRHARARLRVARTTLVRLDPYLTRRRVWTRYGSAPGKRGGLTRYGFAGSGR